MIKSGNGLFEVYNKELTFIYGEPSTGKTTLVKLAAIEQAKQGKKVVYIDTEEGFNLERVKQLAGEDFEEVLKNLIVFKSKRFREQNRAIKSLPSMKNISLIIVDTIGRYYRLKVKENPDVYNLHINKQFNILKTLSENIPIVITNQVYANPETKQIVMVGGNRFERWGDRIIKLEKEPRKIVFERPEKKWGKFEIKEKGVEAVIL